MRSILLAMFSRRMRIPIARPCANRAVPTGLNPATLIGSHVTIEPFSVLRACRVESKVLIGARSVICEVGRWSSCVLSVNTYVDGE